MYFRRVRHLDCPEWMQQQILYEIDNNKITQTGMSEKQNLPPKELLLQAVQHRPEVAAYADNIYGTNDLTGWDLTPSLSQQVYQYYDSFLSMVPDSPKIIIKHIMSERNTFWIHCGRLQLSSLTCVIKTDCLANTVWHEPLPEHEHKFRAPSSAKFRNIQGKNIYPLDSQSVTSIRMHPWEMILFDHNSFHSVEEFKPNMERILFSIGFLNTTETELEDIYDRWSSKFHQI